MNALLPARYRLDTVTPSEGLARVWKAGLFLNDEETSRVMYLADPQAAQHECVLAVWLVHDLCSQTDEAMAMVSTPADDSGPRPVLNLLVAANHQGQGIGKALLEVAKDHYADQQLAGYYTLDSVRLYLQAKLFPAQIQRNDVTEGLLAQGQVVAAAAHHVDLVRREREAYDSELAKYQRRPRPF